MRLIVDFVDNLSKKKVNKFMKDHGLTVLRAFDNFTNSFSVEAPDGFDHTAAYTGVEAITSDDAPVKLLAVAEKTNEVDSFKVDPESPSKWWVQAISKGDGISETEEWTFVRRGAAATVYMVDSGCDVSHPEFESASVTQLWSFVEDDHTDQNGHGTALTSVLVGKTTGMCRSHVKQIKIFDKRHTTYIADIIAGFDAILTDHQANLGNKVVNLSWSIPRNAAVETKISQMNALGLLVVCAAGNSGVAIEDVTPAAMPEVLTVGAFNPDYKPCDFSNYTSVVSTSEGTVNSGALDIWAPGEQIMTAKLDGSVGYTAGTSVASAITAGCLAFYYGSKPVDFDPMIDQYGLALVRYALRDILDLSDEKYANSANLIAVVRGSDDVYQASSGFMGFVNPGQTFSSMLYHPETVTDVSVEMPEWMTLNDDGTITGIAPDVTEPTKVYVALSMANGDKKLEKLRFLFVVPDTTEKDIKAVEQYMVPADYTLLDYCSCDGNMWGTGAYFGWCCEPCIGKPGECGYMGSGYCLAPGDNTFSCP